ncbi:hypothetical protein JSE7799_02972 [Jannaschia seosinensis]|uniref:Secreted protein n=1 Tax=Jannaschia seosinensis TaxID=313367 RepID=A0A0M7BEM5_9RHOB|nr:hypothetical protein [Jannaschia seosinensis]CUH40242.1 hypothetical protein JSE7799_02972 [Jannaschia seosinensis]
MKTCKTKIFATVATLALASGPALAQQNDMPLRDGERMIERIDPISGATIRIITRQPAPMTQEGAEASGQDTASEETGSAKQMPADDGQSDVGRTAESYSQSQRRDELAFGENERLDGTTTGAIRSADAPTIGVTDPMGETEAASGDMDETNFEFDAAGFDMNEFARELYELGYRQGYVSALTDLRMRAARQQQMRRDSSMRSRDNRGQMQGGMQQRNMPQGNMMQRGDMQPGNMQRGNMMPQGDMSNRIQIGQDANGDTVVVLPPGMTPQMFLQHMSRMQAD